MARSAVILNNPVYPPSMDWALLRREGIRRIERLGSAIWTDFNLHDPGVTILEVLCYAITDLGYRSNLPMADLMTGSASARRQFYTAQEILTNGPVTALDYRKLLVDIPGVKNAWLECYSEKDLAYRITGAGPKTKEFLKQLVHRYRGLLENESAVMSEIDNPELSFPDNWLHCLSTCIREHLDGTLTGCENKTIEEVLIDYTLGSPGSCYYSMSHDLNKVLAFYAIEENLDGVLNYFQNVPDDLHREIMELHLMECIKKTYKYLREYRATDPNDNNQINAIKGKIDRSTSWMVKYSEMPEIVVLIGKKDSIYDLVKSTVTLKQTIGSDKISSLCDNLKEITEVFDELGKNILEVNNALGKITSIRNDKNGRPKNKKLSPYCDLASKLVSELTPDKTEDFDREKYSERIKKIFNIYIEYLTNPACTTGEIFDKIKEVFELCEPKDSIYNALVKRTLVCLWLKHAVGLEKKQESGEGYSLFTPAGIFSVLLELEEGREAEADDIRREAGALLHKNRNLCEDFDPEIKILDQIPLGLCASIELEPEADPVTVQALLYEAIGEYLSPSVRFYTLEEMLDNYGTFYLSADSLARLTEALTPIEIEIVTALAPLTGKEYFGKSTFMDALRLLLSADAIENYGQLIWQEAEKVYNSEPIYQGPMLHRGFVDDSELEQAQPRGTVFKSDLYQVIKTVRGVKDVSNLIVDRCVHKDGPPNGIRTDNWCIPFNCYCLPKLDIHCSRFSFTKGNGYITPDPYAAASRLNLIRSERSKLDRTDSLDLPVPKGRHRPDLSEFTSIQEDFPHTYHVGSEGIASSAPSEQQAKVKQLKGYLLFYDQLLANYLAHLAQIRDIFAVEADPNGLAPRCQPLYDVPNIQWLLKDFNPSSQESWQNFIDNQDNGYRKAIEAMEEGNETDRNLRRNAMLNHLLARFGEQFSDYALNLYEIDRPLDAESAEDGGLKEWIEEKERFLKELPALSGKRAGGFNYRLSARADNTHFWDSDNVEGMRSRVCAQLGMKDWTRHTISCQPSFETEIFRFKQDNTHVFKFRLKENADSTDWLLESVEVFLKKESAEIACERLVNQLAFTDQFQTLKLDKNWKYIVGFWEKDVHVNSRNANNALATSKEFNDKQLVNDQPKALSDAQDLLRKLSGLLHAGCEDDSFHLVEHILLRPRDSAYTTLLRPMICSPDDLSLMDPYSWWLTVVVPDWGERFNDSRRFRHFEQVIRSEAPAHLAIRICKYDRTAMLEFETAYYDWLAAFADPIAAPEVLRHTNIALVEVLNKHDSECGSRIDDYTDMPNCLTEYSFS